MPSLHELQRAFAAALLTDSCADFEPHVRANGIESAARIRIYRNNTRENFLATLRATYPILERLVGEDYFRQLALEYRERFPSGSGDLHHVGERLAEFIAQRFAESPYRYFADIACLEWAYQEVMVAADHASLDIEQLQQVPPADYARLQFRLHPAARLFASTFPVLRIWSANQSGGDTSQVIDLDGGGENVLLVRTAHDVELRLLDIAEFTFLQHTTNGVSLAQATDLASEAGDFDLGATLRRQIALGVLVDFTMSDRQP
jgi:hypothetical protein